MKLGELQRKFTLDIATLIQYAYARGYELTFGDAYRDPRVHGETGVTKSYSSPRSNHKLRLAVDLNLFVNGVYITDSKHEAYLDLGVFWENLNQYTEWGGRFNDGNHFSYMFEGKK